MTKDVVLFLLTQIDSEIGIIDSITVDPCIEECLMKIMHLTEMTREALG